MVVDKAWRYLQDPAVLSYLAEAAKTWRKKNVALIMATQSAVDVTGTAGAEALLESMPTKLFLANPDLPEKAADTFRLNPEEMNTIRELIPKRELYLRRIDAAGIFWLEAEDQIAQIQVKTRHTTVIVLPATENVLNFVVGDSEY